MQANLASRCRAVAAVGQPHPHCTTGRQQRAARGGRLSSHNPKAELQLGLFEGQYAQLEAANCPNEKFYDVLGLGQAMVDFSVVTENDDFLERLEIDKGDRRIISVEERADVLASLDGASYSVSAAGSLSNTLVALCRLGAAGAAARPGDRELRVAMAGVLGSDPLGSFYAAQMRSAGVHVVSDPVEGAHTGTVVVLTGRDAQRTMLSYLGTPAEVAVGPALRAAIARSRLLVVEGYLWELPGAAASIGAAVRAAQACGTVVAMTAGDAGVVRRHGAEMWEAIDAGVDLLFTNASEAAALAACAPAARCAPEPGAGRPSGWSAEAAALALGPHCSLVVVTDGSAGSVISALGQLHVVPPHWASAPPVDTCGAGDAYAAGVLLGFLRQLDVAAMGRVGARVASAVIAQHGAALGAAAAAALADVLPAGADRAQLRQLAGSDL